jgi:monoamine oxidase
VLVIGAGPAGLTTAHLLVQQGVEVQVLEADVTHGGRIKHDVDFVDFPIPLGAEWVHVEPGIFDEIVNDPSVEVTTELRPYVDGDQQAFYDGDVTFDPLEGFEGDTKFVGSSWLDFFNTYLLPGIEDRIVFNAAVTAIDYRGDVVRVTDNGGVVREADRVVVTVPLKILQRGDIDFTPELPDDHREALEEAKVWSGLKAFFVFDRSFYPAAVAFPDSETAEGQRIFYDAAYGQDSDLNVLGLFSVGAQAERYQALSEAELVADVLAELDQVFDGAASASYVRHRVQNWNDQPFAAAAYLEDGAPTWVTRQLAQSIDDRVFFAGDGYTSFDDWSSVHTATRSASEVVDRMLASS